MKTKNEIDRDTTSKEYAEKKIYWRKRNWYYHESITNQLKFFIPDGSSIIEIGCGMGDTLSSLNPNPGVGIDKNKFLLEKGKEKYPRIRFILSDIEEKNPLDELINNNQKFDYLIVSDLIGTLEDIQRVFEKMKFISHRRTKIIVTYYNYFWNPFLKLGELLNLKLKEGEKNWLYIDEIKNLLSLSDFQVVKSGSLMLIPKRIPLLSNFFNRYLARLPLIRRLCVTGFVVANYRPSDISISEEFGKEFTNTVLVPCRNEEGHIESILQRIPEIGKHTEIIFVEGESSDNTYKKIEELIIENPEKDIKLFKQTGKGKGDAVRNGFENAEGEILMILDADMTVAPEELPKFYSALKNGKGEFINGTRLVYQMNSKAMRPLNKLGNIFFSKMFSWLLDQRITDTLCGTKVLFKEDYEKIIKNRIYFGDFDPFGDFDLLFGASKLCLKIVEVPIRYGDREYGTTNINRFRDGLLLFKMCLFAMRKIKFV